MNRINPYETPSQEDSSRFIRARWLPPFLQVGANVVTLITIVVSQFALRRRFAVMDVELPYLTSLAMGLVLPIAVGSLLVLTIAIHLGTSERCQARWETIFICLLGSLAGFYVIACCLAFATRPMELSHCVYLSPYNQTTAMASGLTDQVWSLKEILNAAA